LSLLFFGSSDDDWKSGDAIHSQCPGNTGTAPGQLFVNNALIKYPESGTATLFGHAEVYQAEVKRHIKNRPRKLSAPVVVASNRSNLALGKFVSQLLEC